MTTATKTRPVTAASFDQALVEYVEAVHDRIIKAGERGRTTVDTADLDEILAAVDPALADVACGAVRGIVQMFTNRAKSAAIGNSRMGDPQFVARMFAGQVVSVCTAVNTSRVDANLLQAVTVAQAEVSAIEAEQATALAGLQRAVDAADVAEVMRLRPEVEVVLPSKLDAAKLALVDAQLAVQQATAGYASTLAATSERYASDAEDRLQAARAALDAAIATRGSVAMAHAHVSQADQQIKQTVRELQTTRATLAAALEQDRQRRFRRLAGLAEPAPEQSNGAVA